MAQLVLMHRAFVLYRLQDERFRARIHAEHPDALLGPVITFQTHQWVEPALEGALALVCCLIVAVALAAGGRRYWAFLPVAFPLSALVGKLADGNTLGLAWSAQAGPQPGHWLAWGIVIDTVTVALLSWFVLRLRLVTPPPADGQGTALLRAVPVAVVVLGWWLVGHALPDNADRILVVRALLLVAASALLVTTRLPLPARAAVLLLLPFIDPVMVDGFVLAYRSGWNYLDQVAVVAATAAYVAGVPWLLARVRAGSAERKFAG